MSSAIERAMTAVFHGPEVKKLKVFDHEFNVKPAAIRRSGKTTTATGQISHCLRFRTDDQVYYTVVKESGVVKDIQRKIGDGGIPGLGAVLAAAVTLVIEQPVPADKVDEVLHVIRNEVEGDWVSVVDFLLVNIGLHL